jgi:hypothetical protein
MAMVSPSENLITNIENHTNLNLPMVFFKIMWLKPIGKSKKIFDFKI